jgi:hypothetical protein
MSGNLRGVRILLPCLKKYVTLDGDRSTNSFLKMSLVCLTFKKVRINAISDCWNVCSSMLRVNLLISAINEYHVQRDHENTVT